MADYETAEKIANALQVLATELNCLIKADNDVIKVISENGEVLCRILLVCPARNIWSPN